MIQLHFVDESVLLNFHIGTKLLFLVSAVNARNN